MLFVMILATSVVAGCATSLIAGRQPTIGDLYSVANSDGSFGVIRVLATRERDFYIRIYGDRFTSRPRDLDLSQLSLHPQGGGGFTHVPIVRRYFGNWEPHFIKNVGSPTGDDLTFSEQWARDAAPPPDNP
jgi:hypothetical protein